MPDGKLAEARAVIRLGVLGTMRVWTDDGPQVQQHVIAGDRRTALLVYLALAWPGFRRRESIVTMLWPDERSDQARHSLRQLLHVLKECLGAGVILKTGDEYVGVDASRLWCDAVAFRQAAVEGAYERALALYAGPFCDGFSLPGARDYDRWLEKTRTELHELAADSARLLAYRCNANGNLEDAVSWGKRALRLAPDDEGMLRWLVGVSERAGGVAAALRIYDEYVRTIRSEYDMNPSAEIVGAMAQLRARHN